MSSKLASPHWNELRNDVIVLRSDYPVPESLRDKVALFCDVDKEAVIPSVTANIATRLATPRMMPPPINNANCPPPWPSPAKGHRTATRKAWPTTYIRWKPGSRRINKRQ